MSKVVKAQYDDVNQTLHLLEPLEGFENRETVSVIVHHADGKRPWSDLRGILSGEEGEEFARIIEEAFPTEPRRK